VDLTHVHRDGSTRITPWSKARCHQDAVSCTRSAQAGSPRAPVSRGGRLGATVSSSTHHTLKSTLLGNNDLSCSKSPDARVELTLLQSDWRRSLRTSNGDRSVEIIRTSPTSGVSSEMRRADVSRLASRWPEILARSRLQDCVQ
jgi:hypothetical protein